VVNLTGGGYCGSTQSISGQIRLGVLQREEPVHSCRDIRDQHPEAVDGHYTLSIAGTDVMVYCHDMAGEPKEYLSLSQSGDSNVSVYGEGGNTSPGGQRSAYSKVRLDIANLAIDPDDATFAVSTGTKWFGDSYVFVQPYGAAGDCAASWGHTGRANIDLRGTPFTVLPDQFAVQGYETGGDVQYSEQSQVVNLTGGGYCGSTQSISGQIRLGLLSSTEPPPQPPSGWTRETPLICWQRPDRFGMPAFIRHVGVVTQAECRAACEATDGCNAIYQYMHGDERSCFLFNQSECYDNGGQPDTINPDWETWVLPGR
jgi:hypothetical protein